MRALAVTCQIPSRGAAAVPSCSARPRLAPLPAHRQHRHERQHRWRTQAATVDQASTSAAPAATQEQDEELALLQGVVAGTELEGAVLTLAYDAQRDGWSAEAFHSGVDGRGPALMVALTAGGALVGGYNPIGWTGQGGDSASEGAFLFFLDEGSAAPVKLPKVGGPDQAILRDQPGHGIWFADALVVPLAPGKERAVRSKLGAFYARKPSTARHLYAEGAPVKGGARGTELASLHVWVAAA
ncbi:hypothetical protein ABPG75_013771 [Micractinium tetrahymenae]